MDTTSPLNHHEIDRKAVEAYEALMGRVLATRSKCASESLGMDLHRFMEFLQHDIRDRLPAPAATDEASIGYLIAITGAIHEYLENECGVAFTDAQ